MSTVTKPSSSPLGMLSNPYTVSSIILAISVLIQLLPEHGIPSLTGTAVLAKPYRTWSEFYPHYKTEHTDYTNRLLHLVGTTITSIMLLRQPRVILAGIFSGSIGYILCGVLQGTPNGAYEGIAIFLLFIITTKQLTGSVNMAVIIPLIAYSFAWVGHFYHEHNKPATFIYPTYSLMSDYRMVFNIYTGQETL